MFTTVHYSYWSQLRCSVSAEWENLGWEAIQSWPFDAIKVGRVVEGAPPLCGELLAEKG